MDRTDAREMYRKRMALAIGASIGVHALVLTSVTLDLPGFGDAEVPRPLRMVELPDDWQATALEVVELESAVPAEVALETAGASASAAAAETPAPAAAATTPRRPAIALEGTIARPATTSPSLELTPAVETAAPTPEIGARPARGILVRADAGEPGYTGLHFHPASGAARDAEEDERGGARPGRGIGISIHGPGACPTDGGVPLIGGNGGLGGVPMTGKGMGIIGARPPGGEAINRAGPPLAGGRGR